MTKLKRFLAGRADAALRLVRAVRLRDVPLVLLGWLLMLLIPPEEEAPSPTESAEHARRRDGAQ